MQDKKMVDYKKEGSNEERKTRMTLQEYLESVNLKRRIASRSKSKGGKKQGNNLSGDQDKHLLLEPPSTMLLSNTQYFKLNQQWKSRKLFTSWIQQLKQLCRQYIPQDTQYIQVARLIQKISQFVKTQVQTIKKDNLLLQSYLVTEASYWPEGSVYGGNNEGDIERLSNCLRTLMGKGEGSPGRSQVGNDENRRQQLNNGSNGHNPQSTAKNRYNSSTQPKKPNQNITNSIPSHKNYPKPHPSTSTTVKQTLPRKQPNPNQQTQHPYVYSFKDKFDSGRMAHSFGQKVDVRPFQEHLQGEEGKIDQEDNRLQQSQQLGMLKIHSRNQEEVPRLSLMSRYDQSKSVKSYEMSEAQNIIVNSREAYLEQYERYQSLLSTKPGSLQASMNTQLPMKQSGYNEQKVPLRERKQRAVSRPENNQFEMVVMEGVREGGMKENVRGRRESCGEIKNIGRVGGSYNNYNYVNNNYGNSNNYANNNNSYNPTPTPPTPLNPNYHSPNTISLSTPSTLRRRPNNQPSSTQKQNITISISQPSQGNQRPCKSLNGVYSSTIVQSSQKIPISSQSSNQSYTGRQNIMKRYQKYQQTVRGRVYQ